MYTVKDVAKATGFSVMTISRFFNDPQKLRAETYKKIEKAVTELGYTPNVVAQSLVQGKTNIIFVYIAKDIGSSHPFFLKTIAGIGERLGECGYSMLLSRRKYNNETCDGIIAVGTTINEELELIEISKKKPVVLFGSNQVFENRIDVNNFYGSYMMAEYIIKKGYTQIAYIGIDQNKEFVIDRYDGFIRCLQEYKIHIDEDIIIKVDNNEESGYRATKEILKNKNVQVIICASDQLAIGAIRCVREEGLRVPYDIGITGFDGLGYESLVTPKLTTIEQPVFYVGQCLADAIIKLSLKEERTGEVLINPILQENGSV